MLFLLFSFRGRINRSQYWFGALLIGFGSFVGQIGIQILAASSAATAKTLAQSVDAYLGASALMLPLTGAILWANLAVQWKRFHDRGRPGWLSLIPLVVMCMLIASVIGDVMGKADPVVIFNNLMPYFWVLVLMGLAMFIDLGCLSSEDGPNKYGDPPGTSGARGPGSAPGGSPNPGLVSAQSAMDRAIAQRDTAPAATKTKTPGPGFPMPQTAPAGAGPRGFGRRTTS